jgi:hypothetical protein
MRYSLLMYYPELSPEQMDRAMIEDAMRAFQVYAAMLSDAGVLASAEVLQPSVATTTLRLVDGTPHVQDGPFADSKEQLAGTFVIDVDDVDAALEWARSCPALPWGSIEIRPTATRFVNGSWTA